MPTILIINNHDSFAYNLVQLVREAKGSCPFDLVLSSEVELSTLGQYDGLIISPGPGLPNDQPLMMQAMEYFAKQGKPILGICLGCQAIAEYFGYQLRQLRRPLHGHTSYLEHNEKGLLSGLSPKVAIARYHSWVVDMQSNAGGELVEIGYSLDEDGKQTMAIAHKSLPIYGLQFHPESMISAEGQIYISNWLNTI